MWTTVVSSIFLIMTFVDSALSEGNGFSITAVKPRISEFKTNLHRILEGARMRKKRQLEESDSLVHKLKFESATPGDLPYLSDFNLTFWIPVYDKHRNQVLIGTTGGHIILFEVSDRYDNTAVTVALSELEDVAVKARAFTYYNEQWFAVLHYSGREYYIRMYQRIGRGLERQQKIDLTGFSDIELVTMKGIHYLVVSSYSSTIGQSFSYQASVTLYHWTRTQFDAIASRMAYGARSVVCWILDGSLYIAIAQEINDEGNLEVGSPIFLYNSKEENRLVLWEILSTFGPSKIQHFYVAGSHYIIVIGRRDAVIYWWSSNQFLEWQSLSGTADASDVSILTLGDGEVAIVIALKEEALFYTLDSSGLYIITFTMSFRGSNLRSLQFMFSGRVYYALALFAESHQHSIYRLTLASHYLPSVQSLDPLQQCLLDTQQLLKERQIELEAINADLNRVWLKGSNQTITSKVIVEGSITSNQQSRVRDIIIVRYANIPDASMSFVIAALAELSDLAEVAEHGLDGAVLKSTRQEIQGFKHFKDHVYIPSLTMEITASDVIVNDVRISRLQNYALRKVGDQVFLNTISVSNMYSEATNVASLNGISTDDFLLLHGKQNVRGSLTFSDISANNAFVGFLNSIPIQDIITTNSPQNIRSLKAFTSLKSNAIDVQGETNEVDLSSIREKIATVDNYDEFMGQLTFLSPVTINGSMFLIGKINKMVDMSTLIEKSVKRDTQQDLTGHYTFKGKQTVNGDLLVGGDINKISLDNILTLSSNQKIYADISFSAPLTVRRDLIVDAVNGVDLSEQVLRKTVPHQFINGRKTFTKDITADFIDMTEYVTLDGVDPSFLVQDIVQHSQGVVKQNSTVLKDVEVLGNLNVLGDINGVNILDFIYSVWLKSVEQTITVPVTSSYLHFTNDLSVNTVNNLNLDSDVVHTYMDEVIEAPKTFDFKTVLETLKVTNGTINGIDLKSFRIKDKYRKQWEIQGTKTMTSLDISGNLAVTKLNELEVADIMQPNANQIVYGPVEFTDEVTHIQGNVRSGTISFGVFNGQNLQDYFRNAAVLAQPYKLLGNKHFKHLKATNMSIPSGSKISGVSVDELMRRAVTLNVPQLITAPKTFASTLNFKKLMNAATVNGLGLSNYLDEVVLTDEVSEISRKQFSGGVQTTNAFVRGVINGIKIEKMAANAFYKSEDNVVTEHFIFEGDVDVDDLFTPVIDSVAWKDLIFLQNDEILEAGWFLSNVHAEGDIFITGLLNGCDLSQISSSLYTNKSTQVVKKNFIVQNVLVVGNLKVKKAINKISLEDLENLVTTSEEQIISSDATIDANLVADKLNLTDLANSNLVFIVQDAVRHSIPQEITGEKVFNDDVDAIVLSGGDVFTSKVNGVDLQELELITVWKNGYREIDGDKILSSLVMNVAIVNGYLNGLKLPEDVVRTDVSEHIAHSTYFMSEVYVSMELAVHGQIDGVNLNELIHRRITLSSNQNMTAELTFHDDAIMYDELTIDGTVNEIVLDLVAKVKSVHPLQGYKIFVEFHVSGPVTASSVNGFDMAKLSDNILRYNKDEYITEVQVFEKPVHVQNSFFVEWINDVPIRQLTAAFTTMMSNLRSVIGFLQDLSFSLQQRLNLQMSATEDQVYKFAYFTLFQEIDVGPTLRILHGYSLKHSDNEFSHSLVVWTEEKHCVFMEKCCHLEFSYWLRVKKNGVIMVDSAAESGRYYPIPNVATVDSGRDFFIWKNSTDAQPEWCTNKNARMVLASSNGPHEIYIDTENSALLSDVKAFRKGHLYAAASFYFDPKHGEYSSTVVYVYDEKRHWSEHQVLPSFGVLSLDVIGYSQGYKEDILMALGTGMNTDPPSYSTVYKWNNDDRAFDLLQHIPSRYVTSTLWVQMGKDLLLALAGVDHWPNKAIDCSELVSGGQIDIYSYKEHLQWIQSIPVGGVVSMVSFSVDGDTYLAAASIQYQTIYIFEWRGYAGFAQIQTISDEVRHLNIYYIDDDVYMTVASVYGSSKILKMVRAGKQSTSIEIVDLTSSEQQDGVPKELKIVTGC